MNHELKALILEMRSARNLGARRLQTELMRLHGISLSLATINKVLSLHQVKPIKKFRLKADYLRLGDRVQLNTALLHIGVILAWWYKRSNQKISLNLSRFSSLNFQIFRSFT